MLNLCNFICRYAIPVLLFLAIKTIIFIKLKVFFYFIATTLFLRFIKYTEYELQSWNITLAERNSRSVSPLIFRDSHLDIDFCSSGF